MNKMNLNDLTREELVAIITDNRNVIQNLQQKCDEFEIHIDKWKQKSKMMQKMQQDLNDVVNRYINDVETKGYKYLKKYIFYCNIYIYLKILKS